LKSASIRPYGPENKAALIELTLEAWTPVFAKMQGEVPRFVYDAFYPEGWKTRQADDISALLDTETCDIWVAARNQDIFGFVGLQEHPEDRMGEISILAVSPRHQRRGIGRLLVQFAADHFSENGLTMMMVETVGGSGHAPARRVYEDFGFQKWPAARYFKKL